MPAHIMNVRAVASLLSLSFLAGCSGAQFINAITPGGGYSVVRGIPFGDQGLKLDVYRPDHAAGAPVVVFFYGGSWQSKIALGRGAYKFVGQALTQEGYVAVIADYRLYPQVKYPQFLGDCAQAVAWAHAHAAEYGGDPDKLVLMGHSAGAYNAVMLALQPSYLRAAGGDRSWLRGVVGLAGPYDFLPIVDPDIKTVFGPEQQWPQTQPIAYADGRAPPLLLMAGDNDTVVYVKNTNNLYRRVQDSGGQAEKVTWRSMGHIRIIALLSSRLPGHGELMEPIRGFVQRVTGAAAVPAATPLAAQP
jgi:acetyl esterase/lipase